jgi:hypothetical protein
MAELSEPPASPGGQLQGDETSSHSSLITHHLSLPEVQLRIGVRGQNKADVERFTKEIAPLILTGPPAVTGFAGGRPKVEEIMAYFPALIPKSLITPKVEVIEA